MAMNCGLLALYKGLQLSPEQPGMKQYQQRMEGYWLQFITHTHTHTERDTYTHTHPKVCEKTLVSLNFGMPYVPSEVLQMKVILHATGVIHSRKSRDFKLLKGERHLKWQQLQSLIAWHHPSLSDPYPSPSGFGFEIWSYLNYRKYG